MITEQMKEQLMAIGLTKQQAASATAEAVVNYLMSDDGKILIQEAQNQVTEMQELVNSLRRVLAAEKENRNCCGNTP